MPKVPSADGDLMRIYGQYVASVLLPRSITFAVLPADPGSHPLRVAS